MPVLTADVREGDPTIQASGQYRGTVDVVFDDGRELTINIRAADQNDWNDKVAAVSATAQARMEASDAAAAVDPDADVAASKEASIAQTCVAYIRQAMSTEQAYDAWLLLDRINTYVTNNGGWATAKPFLLAEGLSEDEYDKAAAAYSYLSGAGRPAIMAEAKTIQGNWEAQS